MIRKCADCPTLLTVSAKNRRKRCPTCAKANVARQAAERAAQPHGVPKRVSKWPERRAAIVAQHGVPGMSTKGGRPVVRAKKGIRF
jgi:hypothetical protein